MLTPVFTQSQWHCLAASPEDEWLSQGLTQVRSISSLIDLFQALPVTLKDNHRSTVKRGELWGRTIVAKRPVDKNRRLWMRLSSLFVNGDAATTIENLAKMEAAGIESVQPLFALEKRVLGMVVDSWVCYQYREGAAVSGEQDLSVVVELLKRMHAAGFRHDDPTWNNFLFDENGTLFTIDTKAKPCRGAYHVANDFALLCRDNDLGHLDVLTLSGLKKTAPGYWLSTAYFSFKAGRSWLKSKLKKNRLKNRDS